MTVEVDTNSMAMALQLKNNLDSFLKSKIYPRLEQIFSDYSKKNEITRLSKIEISIDINEGEKLDVILPQIVTKIQREITTQNQLNPTEKTVSNESIKTVKSSQERTSEAFIFFIKNGYYPWWFDENYEFSYKDIKSLLKSELHTIINSTIHLGRILNQFDLQFISKLYYKYYEIDKAPAIPLGNIPNILQNEGFKVAFFQLVFQFNPTSHYINFSNKLYELIDRKNATKTSSDSEAILLQKKEAFDVIKLLQFCNEILRVPIQLSPLKKDENSYSFSVNKSLKDASKFNKQIEEENSKKGSVFIIKKSIQNSTFSDQKEVSKPKENVSENIDGFRPDLELEFDEKTPSIIEEEILLNNAGLVLIHPFIKHFFEKLEFLSEGKIKPEKLDEAVHVLHYLACKQEQPPEHLLLFEKYLCNIPLEHPVKRFITLSERQKVACDELLQAMLTHWKGLKTQNVDALRSEFLMREGKLITTNDRDSLYIQRKTQDILLDSLPWNVHLVKIPWKKKIVFVEW